MYEESIHIDRFDETVSLFGSFDENIKLLENELGVKVLYRGSEFNVTGAAQNVDKALRATNA